MKKSIRVKGEKIEDVKHDTEDMTITYDGKQISFSSYHRKDCCENVYADFSRIKYFKDDLVGKQLSGILLRGIEGMGMLLYFNHGYGDTKIFIPCYNIQNGYYSDKLELVIQKPQSKETINITDYKENR